MRQKYDYANIERLYTEYVSNKIDDYAAINNLKDVIEDEEVLVLVPGNTLNSYQEEIEDYIVEHNPIIISVNFVTDYKKAYAFFGNKKRYLRLMDKRKNHNTIISSNIDSDNEGDVIINYHSLINRGYKYFENSTIMLFNLLKRLNPQRITIAGFDGFKEDGSDNYSDSSFQNERHMSEFAALNKEVLAMFAEVVETMYPACEFDMITPSLYEGVIKNLGK